MSYVDTLVIGAGQAGLALSHELTIQRREHAVLERDEIGARWRRQSWDSLRLLTPNWLNVLPGAGPTGPAADGFATATGFADHLDRYAESFAAPVETGTVEAVARRRGGGFDVATTTGGWQAANVVIATGWCERPFVPDAAARLDVESLTPDRYRRPDQLAGGGVLVVGASATGVQLAAELRAAGRHVTLAVGRHTRLPRTYRGMDVFWWLRRIGALDRTLDSMGDTAAARHEPSLQLVGRRDGTAVDLPALQAAGVRLVGRVVGGEGTQVRLDAGLPERVDDAEGRLTAVLGRIDAHIAATGLAAEVHPAERRATVARHAVPTIVDLHREAISTVLWATGHRRSYPWLHVPVVGEDGEIVHRRGVTPVAGLYVLGQRFQHRRSSNFIGGVGADASFVADHIAVRGDARHLDPSGART